MAQTLDRAVEADEIVAALRCYGFTQADVRPQRRRVGQGGAALVARGDAAATQRSTPPPPSPDRVASGRLAEPAWSWPVVPSPQPSAGRPPPLDVLAEGDTDAVRRAAAAFAEGAYA